MGIGYLKGYNNSGYSNYGNVLHQFSITCMPQLNNKTTVVILGDAKNNWNKTDGREMIKNIKEKAAALYWLNPMDRSLWYTEDCVMSNYLDHCTKAFQCANIEQLEHVVSDIL